MIRVLCSICIINIFLPLVISKHQLGIEHGITHKENKEVPVNNSLSEDKALRVVNGKPATQGQFPYMISIKKHVGRKGGIRLFRGICGGSLIAVDRVLSAAHCFTRPGNACQRLCKKVQMKSLKQYYAVADNLLDQAEEAIEGQWRRMRKVAIPRRHWDISNDVAIAYTQGPFLLNENVKLIPVATKNMDYGSITCKTAGHGRTNKFVKKRIFPKYLMWANIKLIPTKECSKIHRSKMRDYICTAGDDTDIREGDSGGPLVCQNTGDKNENSDGVVVGIACAYIVLGRRDEHTVFTRVSSYRGFIARGSCEALSVSYFVWLSIFTSLCIVLI